MRNASYANNRNRGCGLNATYRELRRSKKKPRNWKNGKNTNNASPENSTTWSACCNRNRNPICIHRVDQNLRKTVPRMRPINWNTHNALPTPTRPWTQWNKNNLLISRWWQQTINLISRDPPTNTQNLRITIDRHTGHVSISNKESTRIHIPSNRSRNHGTLTRRKPTWPIVGLPNDDQLRAPFPPCKQRTCIDGANTPHATKTRTTTFIV